MEQSICYAHGLWQPFNAPPNAHPFLLLFLLLRLSLSLLFSILTSSSPSSASSSPPSSSYSSSHGVLLITGKGRERNSEKRKKEALFLREGVKRKMESFSLSLSLLFWGILFRATNGSGNIRTNPGSESGNEKKCSERAPPTISYLNIHP